eukprot:g4224.t1
MSTFDGIPGKQLTTGRRTTSSAGVAELPITSPGQGTALRPNDLEGGGPGKRRLRRGLRKLGQLRQPQNVIEFLAVAKARGDPLNVRIFNAAITAVAPCEEGYRYALRLLVLMQEEQIAPDRFTLTAIVASCLRSQKWEAAHGVLKKMQRQGMVPLDLRPSRFTTIPGEPGEARDSVLRLLQHLRSTEDDRSPPPPPPPPSTRGGPFGGDGDVGASSSGGGIPEQRMSRQPVKKTFSNEHRVVHSEKQQQLRSAAGEKVGTGAGAGGERTVCELLAAGVRPREEEFLAELKGAAKTKSWEAALRLLDGLREAGYQPRPGAYACAIRACGKAGKWEHSLALMDEMCSRGVEPGEGCNVMALKACADAGLWEKTLGMLKDMRASGVNRSESTFVVAMKACGDAGRWKEALALMDDMRRDGTPPMETTYTTAMKACGAAGEWQQALRLFQEMQEVGIPPTEQCFTAAIRACAKADKTTKASSLLLEMRAARGVSTNMSSYRAVMDAHCRAGDWASAQGLLEDARRDQLKPGAGDLRAMVEACGNAEQHERALSLLEEMRSEGMNLRRTGEKLWWVFNTCRDRQVKDRAWLLMEVEETRERLRLRAERNANKALSSSSSSSPSSSAARATSTTSTA